MRNWNLKAGDPLTLTLAADARVSPTSYTNDHIWELLLSSGDPPALALRTTYGLRARALRIFHQFSEADTTVCDPAEFFKPVSVTRLYPNLVSLRYAPFSEIDVEADYWVPASQCLIGRVQISNHSRIQRQIRVELVGLLTPTEGERMAAREVSNVTCLCGKTANLAPLITLAENAQMSNSPFPSLSLQVSLAPGEMREITWGEAARATPEESLALVRKQLPPQWLAEITRLELLNAHWIEVETGDPDWDTAFMLAQKNALGLLINPTDEIAGEAFVLSRHPDHGYSLLGDGSDYPTGWSGQSIYDAYLLASILLPSSPEKIAGVLQKYLATFREPGFFDHRPGPAGQRSNILAAPLMACLTWQVYERCQEPQLLKEAFPNLLKYFETWFTVDHDRDQDGVPEWDRLLQTGYDDHPLFSYWQSSSQGIDITTAETSALSSLLYNEGKTLVKIAQALGESEAVESIEERCAGLAQALAASWDEEQGCFLDRDRETHLSEPTRLIGQRVGPGTLVIEAQMPAASRLLFQLQSKEETRRPKITIFGSSASGNARIEEIPGERFRWFGEWGYFTGERIYGQVEKIEIAGISEAVDVSVFSAGYQAIEQSACLALWSGSVSDEQARAFIERTLTNPERLWQAYGLSPYPHIAEPEADSSAAVEMQILWNQLAAEGLLHYQERQLAARLLERLMRAILPTLKRGRAFRQTYDAVSGQGRGERDVLGGLAPLGLFLNILGVSFFSPHKVSLQGFNPFPWTVTVKYRGLVVTRQSDKSIVIFPDGQSVVINDPASHIVALELQHDQEG